MLRDSNCIKKAANFDVESSYKEICTATDCMRLLMYKSFKSLLCFIMGRADLMLTCASCSQADIYSRSHYIVQHLNVQHLNDIFSSKCMLFPQILHDIIAYFINHISLCCVSDNSKSLALFKQVFQYTHFNMD